MQLSLYIRQYRILFFLLLWGVSFYASSQTLYDNEEAIEKVREATNRIYAMEQDSVLYYIGEVEKILPEHPVVQLLYGIHVLWSHIPVLNDSTFDRFGFYMYETIHAARSLKESYAEGVYFEMAAKGLMAEYYADRGLYVKAINEANRAYTLLKEGFDLTEEVPDFLFATGIYNYFREAYPDKYPIYRPFLWFFRSGDKDLGISQIKRATQEAILVNIEAYVYLAYIYVRYEETPHKAQEYLAELLNRYPNNVYVQSKYLESLNSPDDIERFPEEILNNLIEDHRVYYRVAGHTFMGIYAEKYLKDDLKAYKNYSKSIELSEQLGEYGDYYVSHSYLGMGNVLLNLERKSSAKPYFERAIEVSQTQEVKDEAQKMLDQF